MKQKPGRTTIKTYTMMFPPFRLLLFRESRLGCPRIARVTSSEKLGTMSKNNWRQITLVREPIWGIRSLTLIISCCELLTIIHRLGLLTCLSCKNPALFTEAPSTLSVSNENGAVLLRFQKDLRPLIVFVSFSPIRTTTPDSFSKRFYTLSASAQMNSTHLSACEIGAKLKPHGSVCPPFWILTVEWSGARSCLFWWRHRFQIASFSPSTLENSVYKKHRFQIAPLCRAFSNGSVFGDRFRRCSVDDSRIRSKTAPFSFENGLVWTGPKKPPTYDAMFVLRRLVGMETVAFY